MRKWIFRFNGEASASHGDVLLAVLESHSLEIVDNSLPRLVLVRGSETEIESVRAEADSHWVITPENTSYQIPDTKRKLK